MTFGTMSTTAQTQANEEQEHENQEVAHEIHFIRFGNSHLSHDFGLLGGSQELAVQGDVGNICWECQEIGSMILGRVVPLGGNIGQSGLDPEEDSRQQ